MTTDEDLAREGAALSDRFGEARATAFSRSLPGLVAELTAGWDLQVESLYPSGATSVVLAVQTADGAPAALKVSPDVEFMAQQTRMLRRLGPTGRAPIVLEESEQVGAVLLERIVPGDTLDSTRSVPPSPPEWAALLHDLHTTETTGIPGTLAERCADMFERIGARQSLPAVRKHVPDALWERAIRDCRELLRSNSEDVVIHGDLHLGNVLDGGERGLVVIDPKLCVGDRCFDMVDYVIAEGSADGMRARAVHLAELAEMDIERLLAWTSVNAVVSAISYMTWSGPSSRTDALLTLASGD